MIELGNPSVDDDNSGVDVYESSLQGLEDKGYQRVLSPTRLSFEYSVTDPILPVRPSGIYVDHSI
jgi:hypothetical protein